MTGQCIHARASSEKQWEQAVVCLARKVFSTSSELQDWLSKAFAHITNACQTGLLIKAVASKSYEQAFLHPDNDDSSSLKIYIPRSLVCGCRPKLLFGFSSQNSQAMAFLMQQCSEAGRMLMPYFNCDASSEKNTHVCTLQSKIQIAGNRL